MKRIVVAAALAGVVFGAALPQPAQALNDDQKKALAIALAIALGVAAAKHAGEWDSDAWGDPFSPSPGVVCVPKPKKCYKNGHLSWTWTRRIFGA